MELRTTQIENNMNEISNEQWVEWASIAYHESGAQYELDVRQEDWMERWLESNGRLCDGSPMQEPETVALPKDHQCREAIKWSNGLSGCLCYKCGRFH